MHGSCNLEKALNFSSRLEKFLEFGLGPLKIYLISVLGPEKSLKFTTLSTPDTFFCKIRLLGADENLANPRCKNL